MNCAVEEVRVARAYLSRVAEPANVAVWAWVARHGPIEAARTIRAGAVAPDVARATQARRLSTDPATDLDTAQRAGIRLLCPEDDDWPHLAFGALERTGAARLARYRAGETAAAPSGELVPPLALWVRGNFSARTLGLRSLAIVGARAATPYGTHVASELSYAAATREVVVVSGGAYGIDAAAHRGALAAEGATVLVSAAGLTTPYPAGHATLYEQVADRGLLVSESPPGASPQRHRFLSRNRIIAALSTATLIVEAARRSGAANTAGHAVGLGRQLLAVPGPITSPMSAGCHELLRRERNPATLIGGVPDLFAAVGEVGSGLEQAATPVAGPRPALDQLDATARLVFDGLGARAWRGPETIAARTGVHVGEVLQALPILADAGLVECGDAGYRVARGALHTRP